MENLCEAMMGTLEENYGNFGECEGHVNVHGKKRQNGFKQE
jgi:hypothetical protein